MTEPKENKYSLHFGIAERGKMYALENNHNEALRHYKEAIRMTEGQPDGSLFFQHYSQCVMESLEKMGDHERVIDYCEKFLSLLEEQGAEDELMIRYRCDILQRLALQHACLGEPETAKELLNEIKADIDIRSLPIAEKLLNWLLRGYTVTPQQVRDLQNAHPYFIVTKDKVNPTIAIDLPEIINHL